MPNFFAFTMLLLWPVIMAVMFKKMPPDKALIWSFLGAYLFLPQGTSIDLPMVPTMNKHTMPSFAMIAICILMPPQKIRVFPQSKLVTILMIVYVLAPILTQLNNREPVFWGPLGLPALTWKDGIGVAMQHVLVLVPFVMAFNMLTSPQSQKRLLEAYFFAALVYSVPMLLEIRLTPQFSNWIYGVGIELFAQQVRFGGFRPVVFLGHGLVAAFFASLAVIATATLFQGMKDQPRSKYFFGLIYLFVILVLCKSVGSILFAVILVPIILFTSMRVKAWTALVCGVFVLSYPVLRASDMVPVEWMVEKAALIQEDRAASLEFRFYNEELLLERAAEKPVTGWGLWDRNRVFDVEDGRDASVTDGYWIIVIGVLGWTGYICFFGMLNLPLLRLWAQRKRTAEMGHDRLTYGIALMLSVNMVELIPNATISNMTWIFAGLLLGATLQPAAKATEADAQPAGPAKQVPRKHVRVPRGQRPGMADPSETFTRRQRQPNR